MSGPFETEREAAASVQHILDSPPGTGARTDGNHRLLEDACHASGVRLGAFDHRILLWLAGWEPSTCVVAGFIARAHRAGTALDPAQLVTVLDALDVAAEYKRDRAATCPDCEASPAGLCGTCEWRLARADDYDALAEALRRHLGRVRQRDRPAQETLLTRPWPGWSMTGRAGRCGPSTA